MSDDLRVVLRTVLEGHRSVETGLWGVVSCTCRRHGMMSRPEYDEHVTSMQLDAVFASEWYREYGRMVAERAWDESRDMFSEDLLTRPDEAGMKVSRPNPYKEES